MSTLVFAAHPDDEVLGCGGTIAKYAGLGESVYIAILGQGVTSRFDAPSRAPQEQLNDLNTQAEDVARFLGAKELFLFGLPDNRFDTVPLLDIIKQMEELVLQVKPDTVFTHHPGDLNIDHHITHRAVLTATRPMGGCPVKRVYSFEVPSSTEWMFDRISPFSPNFFVDISDTIEKKVRAMERYAGEIRKFPHPRSAEIIRSLSGLRGSAVGRNHCEGFQLIRGIDP